MRISSTVIFMSLRNIKTGPIDVDLEDIRIHIDGYEKSRTEAFNTRTFISHTSYKLSAPGEITSRPRLGTPEYPELIISGRPLP
jgi:hypothetical protein